MERVVFEKLSKIVAEETGEILSEENFQITRNSKTNDEFAFMYGTHLEGFGDLNGVEIKVFIWCGNHCKFGENTIVLNKAIRKRICSDMKIQMNSVSNAVSGLVKKKFLLRIGNSYYLVNPEVMWKGFAKNRKPKAKDVKENEEKKDSLKDVKSDFEDGRDNENSN